MTTENTDTAFFEEQMIFLNLSESYPLVYFAILSTDSLMSDFTGLKN